MRSGRISKEEALSFLLAHLVVEREQVFEMNPSTLFTLMTLAAEAQGKLDREQGLVPHEVIESLADSFLQR